MSVERIRPLAAARKTLSGTLTPPPDKSITHRAVMFASLSTGKSIIRNPLLSGDCLSTVGCFKKLGVPIRVSKNQITIGSGERSPLFPIRAFKAPTGSLDCGNSGTTMRLISGILCAQPFNVKLVGDASLSKRPMRRVIEPLTRMGARIQAREERFAPLFIRGNPNLQPIAWKSPVASAQVKSSILLAGLFSSKTTTVSEPVRSRDHSERMLKSLGVKIRFNAGPALRGKNTVSLRGGTPLKALGRFTVPGDFSSAAFFIVAALITPGARITLSGVNLNPTRTGLLNVLKRMGAKITVKNLRQAGGEPMGDLDVRYSSLKAARVRPSEVPSMVDEIPVLSVAATQARGTTVIRGAEELRVKESDRLACMALELKKLGASVKELKDGLVIQGPVQLKGALVDSHHDHRTAMCMAVAALVARGTVSIKNFDCIRISYPGFLSDLKKVIC